MNKFKRIMELQEELQQEIMELQNELYNIQKAIKRTNSISNILSEGYFDKYDKNDRTFVTTNKLVNSKSNQFYEYAIGIKTGYTDPAKNCIVASSKKDDLELICVVLGNENDNGNNNKFGDCINLFNFGFSNYSYKKLYEKDSVYKVVKPSNASSETKELNLPTFST